MGSSSPNRGENIKCLKPPPSHGWFYSMYTWCFFLPFVDFSSLYSCGFFLDDFGISAVCSVLFFVLAKKRHHDTQISSTEPPHLSHWPQHRRIQRQQPCDALWSAMPCGSTSAWTPEFDRLVTPVDPFWTTCRSSMISEGRNKNSKSLFLSGLFLKKYLCKTKKQNILPSS